MRLTTLVRLALAGTRVDLIRVALTALSAGLATLALLSALTVLSIPTPVGSLNVNAEQYTNALLREPGLRGGVAFTMLMLTIPVLALAGQCARLGAPGRDRRLAALRLAGASPRQVVAVAVAETGVASLIGTGTGTATYLIGRALLHRPGPDGRLALPTDVLPAPWWLAVVGLGIPIVATLASIVAMRKVTISPLGVVRRAARTRAPWPWPGLLLLLGVGSFTLLRPVLLWAERTDRVVPEWIFPLVLFGGSLLTVLGVILGTAWVSYMTGRFLLRFTRRPAALLAARRLIGDPWSGSRMMAALLACVVFAGGTAGVRAWFTTEIAVRQEESRRSGGQGSSFGAPDSFYLDTLALVDLAIRVALVIAAAGLLVAVVEGIVTRRRTYAALVATGVPRSVIGRAIAWQSLAPAIPAVLIGLLAGVLLTRGIQSQVQGSGAGPQQVCDATAALCNDPATRGQYTRTVVVPDIVRDVPWPLTDMAIAGGTALAAMLIVVQIGISVLRTSTNLEELRAT